MILLFGYYGEPGGRAGSRSWCGTANWKYIFMANGGREQLFDLKTDPHELKNLVAARADVATELRARAASCCDRPELQAARDNGRLRSFAFRRGPSSEYTNLMLPGSYRRVPATA